MFSLRLGSAGPVARSGRRKRRPVISGATHVAAGGAMPNASLLPFFLPTAHHPPWHPSTPFPWPSARHPHSSSASAPHPLTAIAEASAQSAEDDSEEDEVEGEARYRGRERLGELGEAVIKSGYLWKKGERRKVRVVFIAIFRPAT